MRWSHSHATEPSLSPATVLHPAVAHVAPSQYEHTRASSQRPCAVLTLSFPPFASASAMSSRPTQRAPTGALIGISSTTGSGRPFTESSDSPWRSENETSAPAPSPRPSSSPIPWKLRPAA